MTPNDFLLDLVPGGFILRYKRLKNENAIPSADSFKLVLVLELAGGIALFLRKLGPARKRGFFVAEKQDRI